MIAFVVASLAYFMGFAMAFDMGYEGGVNAGNATGYTLGFQMGNFSGYLASFSSGFNSGNATGYAEGYATGNAQGMKTGNHTGYTTGYSTGYSAGYIESNMNWVEHGHGVRDPTYQEAWAFVQLDQTDKNEYNDTMCAAILLAISTIMHLKRATVLLLSSSPFLRVHMQLSGSTPPIEG